MQPLSEPSLEQQIKIILIDLVNALKISNQRADIIIQLQLEIARLKKIEEDIRR